MKNRPLTTLLSFAFLASLIVSATAATPQPGENIAIGKKYTMAQAPNYKLCKDDADVTQLTDGKYTKGYFWTSKTTVGWQKIVPVVITIDLGEDMPISGISLSTAANSPANVLFPQAINISVSIDNTAYFKVGDLVKLNDEELKADKYTKARLQTNDLKTHGRYLRITITPGKSVFNFVFIDEIEVYAGEQELLKVDYKESDLVAEKK
jgi:hypothetical protein